MVCLEGEVVSLIDSMPPGLQCVGEEKVVVWMVEEVCVTSLPESKVQLLFHLDRLCE